jgi:hypothetical protein
MSKKFIYFILFCMMVPRLFAQALPVSPMQNSVSGVIQQTMLSRGFSANDPRFGATLAKSSTALAGVVGTATAVTVGTVTAPGWASVALAVSVGAVITYAVQLGLDSLTNWLFRTDGKIDESGQPAQLATTTAINAGGSFWKTSFHSSGVDFDYAGGDGEAVARQGYFSYRSQISQSTTTAPTCSVGQFTVICSPVTATLYSSGAPASCTAGTVYNYTTHSCGAYQFAAPSAVPAKTAATLQTAINDLPAADKTKPLNPAVIAALADQIWKNAASQPGYDGLPYVATDPISAPDAASWQQANPNSWPTVSDFVNPQATPSGGTSASPYLLPNTSSPVSTYNPTSQTSTTQTNFGPDPAIGTPSLEVTPTANQILAPILGLFPSFKNFTVPAHSAECPKPAFDAFGKHFVMDSHCTMFEQNRSALSGFMLLAFALAAILIVLSA